MEEGTGSSKTAASYRLRIEGLLGALRSEQVRWLINREKEIKRNSGMSEEAFKQLLTAITMQEAIRSTLISQLSKNNEGTIRELSASTNIPQKQILRQMIALMKRGSVAVAGEREGEYLFTAIEPPE